MNTRKLILVGVAFLVVTACSEQALESFDARAYGLASVSAENVRAHMEVLAADDMEGREAGTAGYDRAAAYVVKQFEQLGFKPAGTDGYYQAIPFLRSVLDGDTASLSMTIDETTSDLAYLEDFLVYGDYNQVNINADGELVYVGYGVTAPELDYDDYADIDVSGKIIVYQSGAPANFPNDQRAFYSSTRGKVSLAVEKGAIGMIGFSTTLDLQRNPWEKSVTNRAGAGMRWVGPDGSVGHAPAQIAVSVHLGPMGVTKLFEGAEHSEEDVRTAAADGRPLSFDMHRSMHLQKNVVHENVTSSNVLAMLEGSDPDLKNEFVIFSAHLDHNGFGAEVDGDDLYNGAYDNAAGVSVMLELARVFAAAAERPRRSLLFAAVTAEEKGLLGADYFARNPTVPLHAIVANVNIDMPIFIFPIDGLIGFGAEHSSLQNDLERAAEELGMVLEPDPFPEEVIFVRSDQFTFVQQGIPAVFVAPGFQSSDPEVDGGAKWGEWLSTYYHKPSDDLSRDFVMESAYRFTAVNYLIALDVANADNRPTWNEGDFFGDKFAH